MSEEARYILAKKIARGGMAEIYLGKHVGEDGFQRLCAIKRILPHYAQDQEFIQMFRDEAHICKRLQHANIVRVEGFEEVEGSYAIIMEYVDGSDLRTLLHASEQASKRITVPMACYIIAECARGLHYAHTKIDEITQQQLGIVHRDISPQNILVSFEGEIKITDFGIADAESKLTETRPGIVKGKYSYMSPEQISAKPVDARTDVFALSIVLWEMLAMRRLFQGENEVDTIQRVKNCKIEKELRELNKDVNEELDLIIKKGLAKDPRKRFKSAGEFEKELRRYMSRNHPDFTPADLGNYLKQALDKRRAESAADIKRTLTETNLKSAKRAGRKRNVDLALESSGPAISLAKNNSFNSINGNGNSTFQSRAMPSHMSQIPVRSSHTTFNKTSYTRSNQSPVFSRRTRSTNFKPWLLGVVATAVLCLGIAVATSFPAQTKPAQIILRTQPSRVKLAIDQKIINRGNYVRASSHSPLRITLKPGKHVLNVYRQGYTTYTYDFDAEPGDRLVKDDIVLKEKIPLAAVKVKMRPADKPLKLDIDDGYYVATLIPGQVTAVAPDLHIDRTVSMAVFTAPKEKGFKCSFTPHSTNWRSPDEVIIDRRRRRCYFKGP